jgi:uncharacterized repeat protein (TIGR01451 family)
MNRRERSIVLKAWAIPFALALVLLPVCERLLKASALAGQRNSNRATPPARRPRKITPKGTQSTDQQTGTAAAATAGQNSESQPQNSNAQPQPRAYRVEAPKPDVKLEKIMSIGEKVLPPENIEPVGAEITYTTFFKNEGTAPSHNLSIIDPVQDRTDFKLGSVESDLGTTGLAVTISYSKDGGEKCDYAPVSGGGGAPDGFDRLVNAVCLSFSGDLSQSAQRNAGSFSYVGRRR